MPKEYIEREAVLRETYKAQDELESNDDKVWRRNKPYFKGLAWANRIILDTPAADVVEEVHGEWKLRHVGHGHYWECSACHTNPCIYVTENTKFCPNCGAKMDGERKEV